MATEIISKIKQKNNADFKVADLYDIDYGDGRSAKEVLDSTMEGKLSYEVLNDTDSINIITESGIYILNSINEAERPNDNVTSGYLQVFASEDGAKQILYDATSNKWYQRYTTDLSQPYSEWEEAGGTIGPIDPGDGTTGQENIIEIIKVNGNALAISSKTVNISVPTKVMQLTDADNYALKEDISDFQEITEDDIDDMFDNL